MLNISSKTKRIIAYVSILLAAVLLVSCFGFMTKGFTERDPSEWVALDRNELNLFDNTREEEKTIHDGDGIDITMKKDGSIFVSGKYTLEGEKVVELGTVTLDAGTYTFSSGYKKTSLGTMYLKMDFGGRTVTADFTGHNKITVDA